MLKSAESVYNVRVGKIEHQDHGKSVSGMSDRTESKKGFTRRQILKGAPIAIAGAAALGMVTGRVLPKFTQGKRMPNVPEDSIFAPDPNRYPRV